MQVMVEFHCTNFVDRLRVATSLCNYVRNYVIQRLKDTNPLIIIVIINILIHDTKIYNLSQNKVYSYAASKYGISRLDKFHDSSRVRK